MCINDIRTQELDFGIGNNLGEVYPGIIGGLVVFPGQQQQRTRCGGETGILVPKVMGVACHMNTPAVGPVPPLPVTNTRAVMRAYLVDNWTIQGLIDDAETPAEKVAAYLGFNQILRRKFIGGFSDGDAGTREMYATNFGAGFPPAVPAYGGSDNAYAVVLQWEIPTAELGYNMCLVDWGWDKSMGVES